MRVGGQKLGTVTEFVDAASGEILLQVALSETQVSLISYRLYNSRGELADNSPELRAYPEGLCVRSNDNEVLLDVPSEHDACISYRLYNRSGLLLANSDGKRTQIFAFLRIQGARHPYR